MLVRSRSAGFGRYQGSPQSTPLRQGAANPGSTKWRMNVSSGVRLLHEAVTSTLNPRERDVFVRCLNDYHLQKDSFQLVQQLKQLLDTPSKRRLFFLLRSVVPQGEVEHYDQCCQILLGPNFNAVFGGAVGGHARTFSTPNLKSGSGDQWTLADGRGDGEASSSVLESPVVDRPRAASNPSSPQAPLRRRGSNASSIASSTNSLRSPPMGSLRRVSSWSSLSLLEVPLRTVVLKPRPEQVHLALGFSVRGGRQQGIGIYVTQVDVGSHAESQGLVAGDQIISANDIPFELITIEEAVNIMKHACPLVMQIQRAGQIPGSFETHKGYVWADAEGKPRHPPLEVTKEGRYVGTEMRLLEKDERRVELMSEAGRPLGLMIRGGKEYGLGVYITRVDNGSLAEDAGLSVGEQILDAGTYSFLDITHADACEHLKKNDGPLVLTIKSVGCLPQGRIKGDQPQVVASPQESRRSREMTRSSQQNSISHASTSSLDSSASAAAAAIARQEQQQKQQPENRRTRSASPLTQLSHLAARLPTPSSLKLKRKQKKQKSNKKSFEFLSDNEAAGSSKQPRGAANSRLSRPRSSPVIMGFNDGIQNDAAIDEQESGSIFRRGVGSQLNLAMDPRGTILAPHPPRDNNIPHARLSKEERQTLNYYLDEYLSRRIRVDYLATAVLELCNSCEKFYITSEIRGVLAPQDVDKFDAMVLRREVELLRARDDSEMSFGVGSSLSSKTSSRPWSSSSPRDSVEGYSPILKKTSAFVGAKERHPTPDLSSESSRDGSERRRRDLQKRVRIQSALLASSSSASKKPPIPQRDVDTRLSQTAQGSGRPGTQRGNGSAASSMNDLTVRAEIHDSGDERSRSKTRISYSDDSGVDTNGHHSPPHGFEAVIAANAPSAPPPRAPPKPAWSFPPPPAEPPPPSPEVEPSTAPVFTRPFEDSVVAPTSLSPPRAAPITKFQRTQAMLEEKLFGVSLKKKELAARVNAHLERYGAVDSDNTELKRPRRGRDSDESDAGTPTASIESVKRNQIYEAASSTASGLNHGKYRTSVNVSSRVLDPPAAPPPPPSTQIRLDARNGGARAGSSSGRDSIKRPKPLAQRRPSIESMTRSFHGVGHASPNSRQTTPKSVSIAPGVRPGEERNPASASGVTTSVPVNGAARQRRPDHSNAPLASNDAALTTVVQIRKSRPKLGIAIEGGANTRQPLPRVISIQSGGCAAVPPSSAAVEPLKVGHVILDVDGKSLRGLEHREACRVIAESFKNRRKDHMELLVMEGPRR